MKKTCHAIQKSNLKTFRRFEKITQSCPTSKIQHQDSLFDLIEFLLQDLTQSFPLNQFLLLVGWRSQTSWTIKHSVLRIPVMRPSTFTSKRLDFAMEPSGSAANLSANSSPSQNLSFPALASPVLSWWMMSRLDATLSQVWKKWRICIIFRICRNSCMTCVQCIFQTRVQ